MTQYNNSAEGGTNGTTVTTGNSGGSSGDAWDSVSIGSGSSLTFDNSHPAHGSLGYKVVTGPSVQTYLHKAFPAGGSTHAFRFYVLYTSAGGATIVSLINTSAGVDFALKIIGNTLQILDNAGSVVASFSTSLTANTLYRIEGSVSGPSAGNGSATIKLFSGDSTTPIETQSLTNKNFGIGATGYIRYGSLGSSNLGTYWFDDLAENDTGTFIGVPTTNISISRTLLWNTKAIITPTRTLKWNTKGTITVTRTLLWNTKKIIISTKTLLWNTRTQISIVTRTLLWNVKFQPRINRVLLWNTKQTIIPVRTLLWNTRTIVPTITRTLLWGLKLQVLISRTLLWNTKRTITPTRTLLWNTRLNFSLSRTLLWNVTGHLIITRTLVWDIFVDWTKIPVSSDVWTPINQNTVGWTPEPVNSNSWR